ncbi:MAG TPA: hypothetical protein VNK43_10680 [Gemmatimonadales bacterium]|nr:hypothetical protein [Gemmatimonadales bacterium]
MEARDIPPGSPTSGGGRGRPGSSSRRSARSTGRFICERDGQAFATEEELRRHEREAHAGVGETAATGTAPGTTVRDAAREARDRAKQMKDRMAAELSRATGQVKERARATVDRGKGQVADQIGAIATAFQEAGARLRGERQPRLAEYTDRFAGQVDRAAAYLRSRAPRQMLDDVEALGRRNPAVFIGGAFALGLLAARFLKSSERRTDVEVTHTPGAMVASEGGNVSAEGFDGGA